MEENLEKPKDQLSKRRKFLIGTVISLGFLFIVVTILAHLFLDAFVKAQITRSVHQASKGLYSIKIGDLEADFWGGDVNMSDLYLYQEEEALQELIQKDSLSNPARIDLKFEGARINNIRWINYLISKDLKVGTIQLFYPNLEVKGTNVSESIRSTNKNFIELLPSLIAGFAGSLEIEKLVVKEGIVNYEVKTKKGVISQKADSIMIALEEILIDTVSTKNLLYSEDIKFDLRNYHLVTAEEKNSLYIGEINASLSDSLLNIENLNFQQNRNAKANEKSASVKINNIKGDGVNFRSFIYGKEFVMNRILISSPKVDVVTEEKSTSSVPGPDKLNTKNILVPGVVSTVLESFNINVISIRNGDVKSKIIQKAGVVSQEANSIALDIIKVEGETSDTLNLSSPENINLSLKNYTLSMPDPNVNMTIKSVNASTISGLVAMEKLTVKFAESNKKGETFHLTNYTNSIKGDGFNLQTILSEQKVVFKNIVIRSPDLTIKSNRKNEKKSSKTTGIIPQGLPEGVSRFIRSFEIGKIAVKDATLKFNDTAGEEPVSHQIKNADLTINNVYSRATSDPINFDAVELQAKDYELKVGVDRFSMTVSTANVSSITSTAKLSNIKMIQDHPPGKEENHFNATIPSINAFGLDIKKAVYNGELSTRKLNINDLDARFLIHLGKGVRPGFAQKMPNEIVQLLPIQFRIDTLNINNAFIKHEDASTDITTLVTFEKSQGTIYNLTNNPNCMSSKSPAVLKMSTYIMGKGKLEATIKVPLLSKNFNATYKGTFSGMSGMPFNKVLSLGDIELESGVIDHSAFDITIRNSMADGEVTFLYHNLDIRLLNKEGGSSWIKSRFGNFLAKNSNPKDKGDEPETVSVDAERRDDDSFFSFLWRPILEGIIKTVTKDSLLPDSFTEK